MICEPHWTAYVTASAIPAIALLGAYIAYLQWRTNQNKLKFELFEKRYEIYAAAGSFVSSVLQSGTATNLQLVEFLQNTRKAKWLLSEEIHDFLEKEIYYRAVDLNMYQSQLEGVPPENERTDLIHKEADIKKDLLRIYKPMDQVFSKYLKLEH